MDFRLLGIKLFLPSALNSFFQFLLCKSFQLASFHILAGSINHKFLAGNGGIFRNLHSAFTHSMPFLFVCAKNSHNLPGSCYFVFTCACHCHAALQGRALVIQHPILSLKLVHMQSATKRTVTDQRIGLSGMILHISIQMGTNADLPRKIHRRNLDLLVHPVFVHQGNKALHHKLQLFPLW